MHCHHLEDEDEVRSGIDGRGSFVETFLMACPLPNYTLAEWYLVKVYCIITWNQKLVRRTHLFQQPSDRWQAIRSSRADEKKLAVLSKHLAEHTAHAVAAVAWLPKPENGYVAATRRAKRQGCCCQQP